jgi:MarR family transcriptional regulator, lower aerobic nicotinate degradation pathway regulator
MTQRAKISRPASSSSEDVRRVLDSIRRVVRVLRLASRDAEKQVGLSAAQLFVLQKLAEEKWLSVNELAARTHTHQSSVSAVVQRLVDRSLVLRARSRQDARQSQLSVTPAGRAVLRSTPSAAQGQLIDALTRMPVSQLGHLATSLRHLLDLLGIDASRPVAMLFEEESDLSKRPRKRSKSKTENRKVAGNAGSRSRTRS